MSTSFTFDEATHTYSNDGRPLTSCTQVLRASGFVPPAWLDQDELERRSELGREVHKACDLNNRGKEFTCDEQVRGYLNSWIETKRILALEIVLSEHAQLGTINGMSYGMKLDALALAARLEVVVEYKIGPVMPHHGLQLAGYAAGLYHRRFETPLARFRIRKRIAFQLKQDGALAKLHRFDDPSDFDAFAAMLYSMHWKQKYDRFYRELAPCS